MAKAQNQQNEHESKNACTIWTAILAPYGWDETLNKCAEQFLESYPECIPIVIGKSEYKIDLKSMIIEANKYQWRSMTVDEIRKEFAENGISGELSEVAEPEPKRTPDTDKCETIKDLVIEKHEKDMVLQEISNQRKPLSTRHPGKCRSKSISEQEHCVFCLNNGADRELYESHRCKDPAGNVICPVLQKFVCMRCKATGSKAHTAKYCPLKPIITPEDCLAMEQKWQEIRRTGVEKVGEKNLSGRQAAGKANNATMRIKKRQGFRL
uniref:Nanos-type domain-containing protein n=1 Tax=Anopheles christyi TaxID=43041 RepID=A0A182JP64_9DIPT